MRASARAYVTQGEKNRGEIKKTEMRGKDKVTLSFSAHVTPANFHYSSRNTHTHVHTSTYAWLMITQGGGMFTESTEIKRNKQEMNKKHRENEQTRFDRKAD